MANTDVTDPTLTYLRGMTNLRELDLSDSQVTDDGMPVLAKRTSLEVLRLRGSKITDGRWRDQFADCRSDLGTSSRNAVAPDGKLFIAIN